MVESLLFISVVIVAITEMVKMALPKVSGWVTLLVCLAAAILVSLFDGLIGVTDISPAQAFIAWFGAVGFSTLAGKAGGGSSGDATTHSSLRR